MVLPWLSMSCEKSAMYIVSPSSIRMHTTEIEPGNYLKTILKSSIFVFVRARLKKINGNVNIQVPFRVDDSVYLALIREAFEKWARCFRPEMIFWN